MMGQHSMGRRGFIGFLLAGALLTTVDLAQTSAQVRSGRRGAVAKGDDGAVAAVRLIAARRRLFGCGCRLP